MEISQKSYLKYLNQVFPHWGNEDMFNWCFKNKTFKIPTDIFILPESDSELDKIAAGSAVVYREIDVAQESKISIGIMTGSWTLPEYRNKGFFTKIIEKSLELIRVKKADALCAFVTETNASSRRLVAAGSIAIPAYYLFFENKNSNDNVYLAEVEKINIDNILLKQLFNSYMQYKNNKCCFSYNFDSFVEQYISRPEETYIVRIAKRLFIIEENLDTIKVLFAEKRHNEDLKKLATDLLHLGLWATNNCSKKLYYYTTNKYEKESLLAMDFSLLNGYFTVLQSKKDNKNILNYLSHPDFEINLGDKM